MYLLEEKTIDEQIAITLQCEPFFLFYKKKKELIKAFNTLNSLFKNKRKYEKELWVIITATVKAIKYNNCGCFFSLNSKDYAIANRIHKQKINLIRIKKVVNMLHKEGFITFYKGFNKHKEYNRKSCFLINTKLKELISSGLAKKVGVIRDPLSYIEIRDINNKTNYLSVVNFIGYDSYTRFMEKYNNFLSNQKIEVFQESSNSYVKCCTIYKRVFVNDFQGAGRFYGVGNDFQYMKSNTREHIKINNEKVTEIDYSNMHPRILYSLKNIKLDDQWDAYEIPSLLWVATKKDLRNFLKECYLVTLCTNTKEAAIKSVLFKANNNKNINITSKKEAAEVVDQILIKNKEIKEYFFQENLWAKLQNIDSHIAKYIIEFFTKKKIVCLGWHDSFIVPHKHQDMLIKTMKSAWLHVLGNTFNLKYKIDF